MIAQLTGPFDILIRGVGLKADQLRVCIEGHWTAARPFLQELLLGKTVAISKPFDSVSGRMIMANKDARENEIVRCSLLNHVLTSQALRSDMVSCIDADGTVHYRHNRGTEYLKKLAELASSYSHWVRNASQRY